MGWRSGGVASEGFSTGNTAPHYPNSGEDRRFTRMLLRVCTGTGAR
jgi:hypothetical protein